MPASFRRDTVTLGWEDRLKTRGRDVLLLAAESQRGLEKFGLPGIRLRAEQLGAGGRGPAKGLTHQMAVLAQRFRVERPLFVVGGNGGAARPAGEKRTERRSVGAAGESFTVVEFDQGLAQRLASLSAQRMEGFHFV